MEKFVVAALYKFVKLPDYQELQPKFLDVCNQHGIRGTILVANEGINGTIAGLRDGIDAVLSSFRSDSRLTDLEHKESFSDKNPFYRMKVRLKKEIVTMGVEDIDPSESVGTYVDPQDWNALLNNPEVVVLDTRNSYEFDIGTFKGAVNPEIETFREFPQYFQENFANKKQSVAMFCTGGIRCEKSTAYAKQLGFEKVYHLKGGILKYLEQTPKEESLWEGDCFVFDNRVAVTHGLTEGEYDQCFGCRHPISKADVMSQHYVKGVSCPHCFETQSANTRMRAYERQKQMDLAKQRHESHLGMDAKKASHDSRVATLNS